MDKTVVKPDSHFLIYNDKVGKINIDVRFENDNIWLTQANLVELYQSSKSNVSEHVKHIYEEGELDKISTVRNFRTVASNGKTYDMEYYNLDMIISLGYRIKSHIATQFRIWATDKLHGFLTLNERDILLHAGKISHELAKQHAESEYEIFRIKQAQIPYNTDFEKFIDEMES
jgi:hypothetical protein